MKVVYLIKAGHIPSDIANNKLTAYECLKAVVPLLERDYLKSYEQVNRDLKKERKLYECMTPTGYYTIQEFPLRQRKSAKA